MALNPATIQIFLKLCKKIDLDMLISNSITKNEVTELVLKLQVHKARIKGVSKRL